MMQHKDRMLGINIVKRVKKMAKMFGCSNIFATLSQLLNLQSTTFTFCAPVRVNT